MYIMYGLNYMYQDLILDARIKNEHVLMLNQMSIYFHQIIGSQD